MPSPQLAGESRSNATDIVSALLLAGTGGVLDAVIYLDHGHVFANAMTGNVIFLAIALVDQQWAQTIRHLVPLTGFLLGVLGARLLHRLPVPNPALAVIALESLVLLVVGLLPPVFPQLAYIGIVAFVSAFQVATFRRVGRFTYNSTFLTGNLRMFAEGLFDHLFPAAPDLRAKGAAQAWKLGVICLAFFAGALAGSFVAQHFPSHALLLAEPPLLVALYLVLRSAPAASLRRTG